MGVVGRLASSPPADCKSALGFFADSCRIVRTLILLSVELARGLRAAAYQSKINKINTMATTKLILILALASSLAACFGVSSSDDADDNANGGNGNGGEEDTETFANCPAGTFQWNNDDVNVNFSYAAFDHDTTQEVTHTQEDAYADTVSKLTLECDNAVVSEQENSFSQEADENTLDVALINQYLAEKAYTQINSASVTFQPLAQAADTNYSYQVNAEVNAPNIYAIGNSQVGQNFMVAEATIAANAYLAADENDKTQMNLSASYLSGTANDQNISAIITSGIKLSQLEQQLEDLEQNGDFITTSGAILSYIASNSTLTDNSEQAYLTRDIERADHGSPIHSMGIAFGSGPSFTAFGNPYLIDNEGNTISIKAKSDGGAVGSLSNGTYSLPADFANSTDGIIRTDGEDLANGSYVLAQQFSDNSGAYRVVNLGIFLKGTKAPPTGIYAEDGSIYISGLEH